MDTPIDQASLAVARAAIYRFFASAYLAPPDTTGGVLPLANALREMLGEWGDEAEWDSIKSASADELRQEYYRRFVVPGASYVPPYESVYTDVVLLEYTPQQVSGAGAMSAQAGGLLWGPSTAAVERAYAESGMNLNARMGELPDHFGVEMQFLAHLCDAQVSALQSDKLDMAAQLLTQEQAFLTAHPLRWVGQLRLKLEEAHTHSYFILITKLCESYIESCNDTLATYVANGAESTLVADEQITQSLSTV